MGRTSLASARFNVPGRLAWCIGELVGPINAAFILLTLPSKVHPPPPNAILGLAPWHLVIGSLYIIHYINRAFITPVFLAPSMSPIHLSVMLPMCLFNFVNSSGIATWLCYTPATTQSEPLRYLGLVIFFVGMVGNIIAENKLFELRRGSAKRKAKSEGKAVVTYDKVYVIPPVEGLFKYNLYPHYVWEWLEWTGYWMIGGWAFGPAMTFLINEVSTMTPRGVQGRQWYEKKFGKRAVAGRGGIGPFSWT